MSKLDFKEDGYFDNDGMLDHSSDHTEEVTFDPVSHSDGQDSYSLFGIEPTHDTSAKKKKKKKSEKADLETESNYSVKTSSSDEVDTNDEPTSSKKKRKKRKLNNTSDEQTKSDALSVAPVSKASFGSSFITKFLSRKREAAEVPEPPEIEMPNDDYLRLFQDSCKAHKLIPEENVSDSDEDSIPTQSKKVNLQPGLPRIDSTGSTIGASTDGENEVPQKVQLDGPTTFALQFFNLPYRVTVEQLQAFGKRHGYKFPSITMGVDWKTKLPSGSATVQVELPPSTSGNSAKHAVDLTEDDDPNLYGDPLNDDITECIAALQGEDLQGRPLRVQRFVAKKRQSGSLGGRGDSRYFSGDISCKCHSCGQVGHRQQDCTNEAVANPCHLCAGNDHDAGNCPNITCYRCGKFGHHSRDCTGASMAKPVICTHCGATTHDARNCREISSFAAGDKDLTIADKDSKVAGPMVRCMSCNMFGHVMCQTLPPVPAASAGEVYCPNCGQSGHHIDFPLLCSVSLHQTGEPVRKKSRQQLQNESSVCMEPKFDAFIKYPQLLREIDSVPANERLGFFRDVTRRSSYSDQMLFPPLARQLAPFNNNPSSSQNQGGARNGVPQGRHSLGGGSGGGNGGGDSGRTVTTTQQRSQSVGPRVQQQHQHQQQGRSGFDQSSALGKRKSNEPELASRYATLYPSSSGYEEGRDRERSDRERNYNDYHDNNNNNNRRNSFPANGAGRGRPSHGGGDNRSSHVPNAHARFSSPEAKHYPQQGSNSGHKSRPPPPPPQLPLPPMAAASASWNAKIESRKRRFQE